MGEETPNGQRTFALTDAKTAVPTVDGHTERKSGMTLHTTDPDPDSDIEIYDDGRLAHRSGNPPEND